MKKRRFKIMKNEDMEKKAPVENETPVEEKINLASPWIRFVKGVSALFGQDKEIKLSYSEEECTLKIFVDNAIKADAISKLFPTEKAFGNVTLKIEVIPSDKEETKADLFKRAFANNPFVSYIKTLDGGASIPMTYVVFKGLILQYFSDDLSDINGNRTVLCQDLAKELFEEHEGVSFCTDVLGENNNG